MADWREWVPARVHGENGAPRVEWVRCGGERFSRPFFEDTIWRLRRASPARTSSPSELEAWATESPGLRPSGFLFHLSRCGSTLIGRMLGALPRCRVLSEATPLDDVLRLAVRGQASESQAADWLCASMSALGQPVREERELFVKWDCWNVHQLPLIRRAFPVTPWVFLYRDPVEVLVSQMRIPGLWTVPGELEEPLRGGADPGAPREEYVAQLLAGICRAALDANATLVNYTELPAMVPERLARHFGMDLAEREQREMIAAARFDAKQPSMDFAADGAAKRRLATGRVHAAVESWMAGIYEEMEDRRKNGQGLGD
ncbi:MAG: sulfotransferase [Candidatus Solibacter sp.]